MIEYSLLCHSLYFTDDYIKNLITKNKLKNFDYFSLNSYSIEGYIINFTFEEKECNKFKIQGIFEKDLDLILVLINIYFEIKNIKYVCTVKITESKIFEEILYKSKEIFDDIVISGNNIMRLSKISNDLDTTDFILNKNYYSLTDDNLDNLKIILNKLNNKTDLKINLFLFKEKYTLSI